MKKAIFIILATIFCISPADKVPGAEYSNLYVFGDSLSDSGQFSLRATNPVDPSTPGSPYADVWSQYFSRSMGFGELLPSTPLSGDIPGNNYAVVAYRTDEIFNSITQPDGSVLKLGDTILKTRDGYLIENPNADPNALYVVWGGGNDIRDIRDDLAGGASQDDIINSIQNSVSALINGVKALHRAGARYILVPNMVNIGQVPESAYLSRVDEGNTATQGFNEQLLDKVRSSGANVILADVNTLFNEFLADATAYGYSSENHQGVAFDDSAFTGIPAVEGVNGAHSSSPDPSLYVFFDGIHPTTKSHQMVAQYFESILMGPELVSSLAEVPLFMSRQHHQYLTDYLRTSNHIFQTKKWASFIQGGYGDFDVDDTHRTPEFSGGQYSFSVGGTYGFSPHCYGGIAVGIGAADVDFQDPYGDFNLNGGFISLITGYRKAAFYVDGMATAGKLEYDKIRRNVSLGPVLRVHTGDTGGHYWGVSLSTGLHFLSGEHVAMGPEAELHYQEVYVDAYRETGSLSTAMGFSEQARYEFSGKLGIVLSYLSDPVTLYGGAAYEKANENDVRYVHASLNTIPDHSFRLQGFKPETDFWVFKAGSHIQLHSRWAAMISLYYRNGDGDIEKAGHLGIQYRF